VPTTPAESGLWVCTHPAKIPDVNTAAVAYLNGKWVPAAQVAVPVYDAGLVLGVAVAEQVRTFRGRLFRLEQHLTRLARSLDIVQVDPGILLGRLVERAEELARRNHALADPNDDLGLSIFITPGPYATMAALAAAEERSGPTVCLHTYPLPFHIWADKYERGQVLVTTDVQQVPAACWPPELKCRSRMHYYLADRQARQVDPLARALLLDQDGYVLEASTANILAFYEGEGLVSPPREKILPGVSMNFLAELAVDLGISVGHRELRVDDVLQADEVVLCSTSPAVWPVVRLNGRPIGNGRPGATFRRLLAAWSQRVGVDIPAQARRFAER